MERAIRARHLRRPLATAIRRLIESARGDRLEILRRAGLEDDLASAQAYLGQLPKGVERAVIGVPELYASDRIRSPGDRTTFVGDYFGSRRYRGLEARSPSRAGVGTEFPADCAPPRYCLLFLWSESGWRRRSFAAARGLTRSSLPWCSTLAGYWAGPLVASLADSD